MKKVGLLGSGIEYSLSPVMHNAAFADLGLEWQYVLIDIPPEILKDALADLRQDPWAGANVTIPYKQDVLPYLDELSPTASLVGAVNTIIRRQDQLAGENTDAAGFFADLKRLGWAAKGTALIFGAGGAARAAALALLKEDFTVFMHARTPSRAENFLSALESSIQQRLNLLPADPESIRKTSRRADLIVNATPLGGAGFPTRSPWPEDIQLPPDACFYDMTYNPPVTPFIKQAQASGLPASSGLGMLVAQGALSFRLWNGQTPNIDLMRAAAMHKLEENHASISDSR
jgi:shikimate dehydrogenase